MIEDAIDVGGRCMFRRVLNGRFWWGKSVICMKCVCSAVVECIRGVGAKKWETRAVVVSVRETVIRKICYRCIIEQGFC